MTSPAEILSLVEAAATQIRQRSSIAPKVALVLGSGLNILEEGVDGDRIPYSDLPGFHVPTVSGHSGQLVLANLNAVPVMIFSGRPHLYEGTEPWRLGLLPRLAKAMGATAFLVTNAAGGIPGKGVQTGDLMRITDHINLQGRNPLIGPHDDQLGARFPDMGRAYHRKGGELLDELAATAGIGLKKGVYVGVLGPSYETPAEVRMYGQMGGHAIGMSTVGEVTVANQVGLCVAGISCISNIAGGNDGTDVLSHAEVKDAVAAAGNDIRRLIRDALPGLSQLAP
ncbi:MAG: purine-nucleoside phosphorylase [Myxococcales bacterium]|nr:purine-nucleoside phosphorylase [Myxococcales bacterium]|tara:strand:+ start:113 stop:961 length:849 start_codon:yes stop_codon:yes gene_type:complete